jgi:LysM repeat protein
MGQESTTCCNSCVRPPGKLDVVQTGDTPIKIAQRNGVDLNAVKEANPRLTKLVPGTIVNLEPHNQEVTHVMKRDTLYNIARETAGLSVADLLRANEGLNPKDLKEGTALNMKRRELSNWLPEPIPLRSGLDAPRGLPPMKQGVNGKNVKALQNALHHLGYYTGRLNGVYTEETAAAVTRLQKSLGMKPDGIYDRHLEHKLNKLL